MYTYVHRPEDERSPSARTASDDYRSVPRKGVYIPFASTSVPSLLLLLVYFPPTWFYRSFQAVNLSDGDDSGRQAVLRLRRRRLTEMTRRGDIRMMRRKDLFSPRLHGEGIVVNQKKMRNLLLLVMRVKMIVRELLQTRVRLRILAVRRKMIGRGRGRGRRRRERRRRRDRHFGSM